MTSAALESKLDRLRGSFGMIMRALILSGAISALLIVAPAATNAGEKHVTGAAIGAGVGAVLAGPPGAIVGGAIGAVVKGPRISKRRYCWTGRSGRRHCEWR